MAIITIDKNVPIPEKMRSKYPWEQMEVGDSFEFLPKLAKHSVYAVTRTACLRFPGKRFETRRVGRQYRCWRVK